MLIPRGKASGLPIVLFVMVSDYEKDKVGIQTDRGTDIATDVSVHVHK